MLGPFVPLCRSLGRIASALGERLTIDRIETEFLGRIADRDTRLLSIQTIIGVLSGHTEDDVNAVNAPVMARERGIDVGETKRGGAGDYSDLVRVTLASGGQRLRVAGTLIGPRNRPHLLEAWGQRFDLQLEDHLSVFRYSDVPGMIGRVGTMMGRHGINIVSAAAGRTDDNSPEDVHLQVMVVSTDAPVTRDVIEQIAAGDGFFAWAHGHALTAGPAWSRSDRRGRGRGRATAKMSG